MIRNKRQLSFQIEDSSVKLIYNSQMIVFNSYGASSRHKFERFRNAIVNSPKSQYGDIDSVYRLARICEIRGSAGYDYTVHKNIAY